MKIIAVIAQYQNRTTVLLDNGELWDLTPNDTNTHDEVFLAMQSGWKWSWRADTTGKPR